MTIELDDKYAKRVLHVLENHTSLCFAIVSQEIKDMVSKEAYDKLMELHMKYHNANCGPFNRHLKKLIDESSNPELKDDKDGRRILDRVQLRL